MKKLLHIRTRCASSVQTRQSQYDKLVADMKQRKICLDVVKQEGSQLKRTLDQINFKFEKVN